MIISMFLGMLTMTSFGQTAENVDTSNNLYAYNKTATELYEDLYTDVTLTVGGNEDQLGFDIIYIIGSYATNSDGTPNVIEYILTENEVDEYYTEITGNYIDGFVITNIIEEEITDNPPPFDSPKTGDATVLFELLGFAAVAVGSTLVIRTRKSRKQMI